MVGHAWGPDPQPSWLSKSSVAPMTLVMLRLQKGNLLCEQAFSVLSAFAAIYCTSP